MHFSFLILYCMKNMRGQMQYDLKTKTGLVFLVRFSAVMIGIFWETRKSIPIQKHNRARL